MTWGAKGLALLHFSCSIPSSTIRTELHCIPFPLVWFPLQKGLQNSIRDIPTGFFFKLDLILYLISSNCLPALAGGGL